MRVYLLCTEIIIFHTGCSYQSHGGGDKNDGGGGGGGRDINAVKPDGNQYVGPQFDPETPRNVTALEGKSAYLTCKVKNLDNKTVRILTFPAVWHLRYNNNTIVTYT